MMSAYISFGVLYGYILSLSFFDEKDEYLTSLNIKMRFVYFSMIMILSIAFWPIWFSIAFYNTFLK